MRRAVWPVLVCLLALAMWVAGSAVLFVQHAGESGTGDADSDGLWDSTETAGWRGHDGVVYKTDPDSSDTDGDGLTDGEEAGAQLPSSASEPVYAGRSDPMQVDSDDDNLDDADEYFLDAGAWTADTDEDGLSDDLELAFGSDPGDANPDGDSYDDLHEYKEELDPFAYDLSRGEAWSALVAGAGFGDWTSAAETFGFVNDAQIRSVQYLTGEIAAQLLGAGAARDIILNIAEGDRTSAGLSAAGLIPVAGTAASLARVVLAFVKRGAGARAAAYRYLVKLSIKDDLRELVFGEFGTYLPPPLEGGEQDVTVFFGVDDHSSSVRYVGVGRDFADQAHEHGAGSHLRMIDSDATDLSLGEARAIAEAVIVRGGTSLENDVHHIATDLAYYEDAVAWGERWLKSHCVTWPSEAPCVPSSFF